MPSPPAAPFSPPARPPRPPVRPGPPRHVPALPCGPASASPAQSVPQLSNIAGLSTASPAQSPPRDMRAAAAAGDPLRTMKRS